MFSSEAYGQKNLLFKDSTSELVPIATQTYEAWLGREYLHAMKGLLCDPNRKSSCLFSRRPSPHRRRGQAFWRGGQRRTLTPEGVCVTWPRWEPVASTFLPLGVGEEDSLESHGLLYPGNPTCSRGWDPDPKGLLAPPYGMCQVLSFSLLHASLLLTTWPQPWLWHSLSPGPLK